MQKSSTERIKALKSSPSQYIRSQSPSRYPPSPSSPPLPSLSLQLPPHLPSPAQPPHPSLTAPSLFSPSPIFYETTMFLN